MTSPGLTPLRASSYVYLREPTAALACAEAAIRLGTEHRFPFIVAGGTLSHGWVLAAQGQPIEGVTELRRAIDLFHTTGHRIGDEIRFDLLAEAYGLAGFIDEGLAALMEARQAVPNEEVDQARTLRLRGELLLRQNNKAEAEANFHEAITVARRQGAKSLELQATMSLCRLWRQQRKKKAARQRLAAIYNWFTEGFDTADLQEATALLKALQA